MTITCAVIGAGGYAGAELVRILSQHPGVSLVGMFGSDPRPGASVEPRRFWPESPRAFGRVEGELEPASNGAIRASGARVVFLATPHEVSAALVPEMRAHDLTVIDLSGQFRLHNEPARTKHYGEHLGAALMDESVYGLAEFSKEAIAAAEIISVPGCYAISAIIPLRPLSDAGLIQDGSPVVIDSYSGVSGAGKALRQASMFCEVSLQAYGVLSHRHQPEIEEHARVKAVFTPHLAPMARGIHSTIHLTLRRGVTESDVRRVWGERFGKSAFVSVLPEGSWARVSDVERTNRIAISCAANADGHLVVTSVIDNLVKGAAGQAVQCMNIRFGLPEALGLEAW